MLVIYWIILTLLSIIPILGTIYIAMAYEHMLERRAHTHVHTGGTSTCPTCPNFWDKFYPNIIKACKDGHLSIFVTVIGSSSILEAMQLHSPIKWIYFLFAFLLVAFAAFEYLLMFFFNKSSEPLDDTTITVIVHKIIAAAVLSVFINYCSVFIDYNIQL